MGAEEKNKIKRDILRNIGNVLDDYHNTGVLHEKDALEMIHRIMLDAKEDINT